MKKQDAITDYAELLKQWRSKRGITQQEAARILNVGLSTYVAIEQGRSRPRGLGSGLTLKMIKIELESKGKGGLIRGMLGAEIKGDL